MRLLSITSLVCVLLAASGCPAPSTPDGSSDAGFDARTDAQPALDASTDAEVLVETEDTGPVIPPAASCMPCLYNAECGEGGTCVELDRMRLPGYRTCQVACAELGAACDASGLPGMCAEGPDATPVCVPTVSCVCPAGMTCASSRSGSRCPTSGRCAGRYSVCGLAAGRDGSDACLAPCTRDSDCDDDYARCREVRTSPTTTQRVCIPDEVVGPGRCGLRAVNARGIGGRCGGMTGMTCSTGLACIDGVDAALPGFCSAACTADADCGGGAVRCLAIGSMGNRCVPQDCECIAGAHDTLLDQALTAGTWTRCKLYYTRPYIDVFSTATTRDRFRLPIFDRVHRDWMAGARWARETGPGLDARATSLSTMIAAAAAMRATGNPADAQVGAVVTAPSGDAPLVDAVVALRVAFGAPEDREPLVTDAADVPLPLQRALAAIVVAITRTGQARDRGLPVAKAADYFDHLYIAAQHMIMPGFGGNLMPLDGNDLATILGDVVLPAEAATALAATIESIDWAGFRGMMGANFEAETPLGKIVLRDGAADMYTDPRYAATALVVDLGGNDTYLSAVAANTSVANSVSVLIDVGGDDRYAYTERPVALDAGGFLPSDGAGRNPQRGSPLSLSEVNRQGAGRLGVGLLYDLGGGADRYRSLCGSQGFGALGIGGLMDDGGNDEYEVEAGGQGSAILGIGVMLDLGGDDRHTAWTFSQGFGYTRGVGILYDRDGVDEYTARLTPVAYISAQDPTVNNSMSQGVGFGRRSDPPADGVNMSGGIGILRDRAGNDRYTCAIFGQGSGYWGGMGLLLDHGGDDQYDGRWYVQGAAAHFAYGALVDGGGVDVHNATATRQNMTGGAGHDFSLGFLLADGSDDDVYNMPGLALGAGNANGAGFFADVGGGDIYRTYSALTCGNAALENPADPGRGMRPTVGIFLEAGGMDTYERPVGTMPDPVRNDATWTQRIHPEALTETGLGADGTSSRLGL